MWKKGGYLVMRRSQNFRFVPHFLWSRDLKRFWSYSPISLAKLPDVFFFFKGYVKFGD
jgi:hypothetical protein